MEQFQAFLRFTLVFPAEQYFGDLLYLWTPDPFSKGIAVGTVLLTAGVIRGLFRREGALWWFLLPVALAHLAVGLAALAPGHDPTGVMHFNVYLGIGVLLIAWAILRCRASVASIMVAVFVATYSLFNGVFATMILTNRWI